MAKRHRNDRLRLMPSSNFFSRRWPVYLSLAMALGAVSPAISHLLDFAGPASRQGLAYWWFMGMPQQIDMLVGPAERYQHLLWSAVFTLQYLTVFAAGAGLVMLIQPRRRRFARLAASQVPPGRQRAFETAAAMYCRPDT